MRFQVLSVNLYQTFENNMGANLSLTERGRVNSALLLFKNKKINIFSKLRRDDYFHLEK